MEKIKEVGERINNEQLYNLLTSKEVGWQAIIYDLINTEQLDPWDIDLVLLTNKYLKKIKQLEEADFFVSSKVLLAASLLLRLKSEILLNKHIRSIDEILFGKKEQEKQVEEVEIDKQELPSLYPKTPLLRYKKVTLQDLLSALNKAISTEQRRIRREVNRKQIEKEAEIVLPKTKISIKDRIRKIYSKLLTKFKQKQTKISYSELTGNKKEEKIACFLPCLHLDNQQKLFLEQERHFSEIYIWLYKHYKKQQTLNLAKTEIALKKQFLEGEIAKKTGFDNPLANFSDIASEIMKGNIS